MSLILSQEECLKEAGDSAAVWKPKEYFIGFVVRLPLVVFTHVSMRKSCSSEVICFDISATIEREEWYKRTAKKCDNKTIYTGIYKIMLTPDCGYTVVQQQLMTPTAFSVHIVMPRLRASANTKCRFNTTSLYSLKLKSIIWRCKPTAREQIVQHSPETTTISFHRKTSTASKY